MEAIIQKFRHLSGQESQRRYFICNFRTCSHYGKTRLCSESYVDAELKDILGWSDIFG